MTTEERRKARKRFLPDLFRFFERGLFAPFLLSIQPVLHLFSINIAELGFSEILRSLFVSFLLSCMVLLVAQLILRDWRRASLVTSLFIFLFFVFGDAAVWLSEQFGLGPARANLLTLAFVVFLLLIWTWLVQKRIRDIASVNLINRSQRLQTLAVISTSGDVDSWITTPSTRHLPQGYSLSCRRRHLRRGTIRRRSSHPSAPCARGWSWRNNSSQSNLHDY